MGRESAPRGASVTRPVPAGSADFLASTNQTAQSYANSLGVPIKVFGTTQVVAPTAYMLASGVWVSATSLQTALRLSRDNRHADESRDIKQERK